MDGVDWVDGVDDEGWRGKSLAVRLGGAKPSWSSAFPGGKKRAVLVAGPGCRGTMRRKRSCCPVQNWCMKRPSRSFGSNQVLFGGMI